MSRYLLEKMDKSELVDTIVDLLEVKALLEYDVDLYRDWYKREQSENEHSRAYANQNEKRRLYLYKVLVDIIDSLNQEDDVTSDEAIVEEIVDTLTPVFKLDETNSFSTEFTDEYINVGKRYIEEDKEKSKERRELRDKLKGTYSYQDEKRRERFRKNNFYKY